MALLIAGTLKRTAGEQNLGALSIATLLAIGVLLLAGYAAKTGVFPALIQKLVFPILCLIGSYSLGLLTAVPTSRSFMTVAQLILVICFFLSMTIIKWDEHSIEMLSWIVSVYVIATFCIWVYAGMPSWFTSYMSHKNSLGGLLFGLLFFLTSGKNVTQGYPKVVLGLLVVISLLLIYHTNSRASWLGLATTLITLVLWKKITKNKIAFFAYFVALLGVIALVTLVYPYLSHAKGIDWYRELVKEYTGASLFSGRDRLWPAIMDAIYSRPVWGHGAGALPSDFIQTTLSSHNIYLQIALQVGVVGLVFFVALLYQLWNIYWLGREDSIVRFSAAFLSGIMIHQMLDISLTQNNLSLGLIFWLILSIGVNRSMLSSNMCPECSRSNPDHRKSPAARFGATPGRSTCASRTGNRRDHLSPPQAEQTEKRTPNIGQCDKCILGSSRQSGSGFVVNAVWRPPVK